MNIYRHQFVCVCPANKQSIIYQLEVQSPEMIYVEKIVVACQMWQQQYHEKIADALAAQFPGTTQILRARHHGVDIETKRYVSAKPQQMLEAVDYGPFPYAGIGG